jgi:hypothetical protein
MVGSPTTGCMRTRAVSQYHKMTRCTTLFVTAGCNAVCGVSCSLLGRWSDFRPAAVQPRTAEEPEWRGRAGNARPPVSFTVMSSAWHFVDLPLPGAGQLVYSTELPAGRAEVLKTERQRET